MKEIAAIACGGLLAACSVNLSDPAGRACDDTHPCAAGRQCVGGLCRVPVAAWDGGALPAFPEAQGGGAASVGGRGPPIGGLPPVVMEVTQLDDNGPGSLRACVQASGPRTCVFRVAGTIPNLSDLEVSNPFLTIAGQTAPGGGILLGGPNIGGTGLRVSTHDVVVRYLSCSADNLSIPAGSSGTTCFEVVNNDNFNIVFDHVTSRWAGNGVWGTVSNFNGANHDITTQWSLFYEPNSAHPVGLGNFSNPSFTAQEVNIDFHHNLFVNIGKQIPGMENPSSRFINNLTFNWSGYAAEWIGASSVDVIGNQWIPQNLNGTAAVHEVHFSSNNPQLPGNPSVFLADNIGPNSPSTSGDPYAIAVEVTGEGGNEVGPIDAGWRRSAPMPGTTFPIVPDDVSSVEGELLATAGASQRLDCHGHWQSNRSGQDTRVIEQVQSNGTGNLFDGTNHDDVVGPGTPCVESLHDGIPDLWKVDNGLSTTDPALFSRVAPNGYTFLETYLDDIPLQPSQPPIAHPPYAGCGCAEGSGGIASLGAVLLAALSRRRARVGS
jgi:uncharacterized protein (TIGR03382 family)